MKTRIAIINYSNTIPFTYGLLREKALQGLAEFSYGYPAQVAQKLCKDEVDMSIISVGAIPSIPNANIISNYCISATKRVDSVLLCSNKPIDQVTTITLDYQSRTSNLLVQILAKYAWNISPKFNMGIAGYELMDDNSAKVIIGDRALNNAFQFEYVYDLALEWYKTFNMPFVFAAWVANKQIPEEFLHIFESACEYGVTHIDEAIQDAHKTFTFDIIKYLHNSVEYSMSDVKRASIELFFEKGRKLKLF